MAESTKGKSAGKTTAEMSTKKDDLQDANSKGGPPGQEEAPTTSSTDEDVGQKWIKAIETDNLEEVKDLLAKGRMQDIRFNYKIPNDKFDSIGDDESDNDDKNNGDDDSSIDFDEIPGLTPLLLSATLGKFEIIQYLLDEGADINVCSAPDNYTALQFAIFYRHHEFVVALLKANPSINVETQDPGLKTTPLMLAALTNQTDIVAAILSRNSSKKFINMQNFQEQTALHYACRLGHVDSMKLLLEAGASLDIKDEDGHTPVHLAALWNRELVIEELLRSNRSYDWNTVDSNGSTALHIAVEVRAASIVAALLNDGRTDLTIPDKQNRTTLAILEAESEDSLFPVLLGLMKTELYIPESLMEKTVIFKPESIANNAERVIEEYMNSKDDINSEELEVIMDWAVLNGRLNLMKTCIEKKQKVKYYRRGTATWLHIAAIKGHAGVITELIDQKVDVEVRGKGGIAALHIATKRGNFGAVAILLRASVSNSAISGSNIEEQRGSRPLEAIALSYIKSVLAKTDDGQSALAMAIQGKSTDHRKIERLLWILLENCCRQISNFLDLHANEAEQLLEMAAQSERRGQKRLLIYLLSSKKQPDDGKSEDWTTLHWAIFHGLPKVVWWLLANGNHLNGMEISRGMRIASTQREKYRDRLLRKSKRKYYDLILALLHKPPAISDIQVLLDDDNLPEKSNFKLDDAILQGTIVDFYKKGQEVDFRLNQSTVNHILSEGPWSIMSTVVKQDIRDLRTLEELMMDKPSTAKKFNKTKKPKDTKRDRKEQTLALEDNSVSSTASETFQFRWLHIPINDVNCIQELMVKIAHDENWEPREHRLLAEFFRKSRTEIMAGGRKKYMKPQFVSRNDPGSFNTEGNDQGEDNIAAGKNEKNRGLALYMPYLSWGDKPTRFATSASPHQNHEVQQDSEEEKYVKPLFSQFPKPNPSPNFIRQTYDENVRVLHKPMTLDQYFYPSIGDTSERDNDQVVSRYFIREKEEEEKAKKRNGETLNADLTGTPDLDGDDSESNTREDNLNNEILMVDQLWLWIIDEKTIITSTSKLNTQYGDEFLQHVIDYLIDGGSKGMRRPESVESMMSLATSLASSCLRGSKVKVAGNKMKSALEIFQESIRYVASSETALFETFQGYIDSEQKEAEQNTPKTPQDENPYLDISVEIKLLREIKDIRDELNILKKLHEDQELVWKQAFGSQENRAHLPTELRLELEKMIMEATEVQNSINTLLDLKQKQANIAEAKDARKQSVQSGKQNDTLMVFTMVTIIFTPMSFLTSFFALNVSDFPHEAGTLIYQGRWIFPIIFVVSGLISAVFISFAFNASWLLDILRHRQDGHSGKNTHTTQDKVSENYESEKNQKLSEHILRRRRRGVVDDVETATWSK